MATPHQLHPPCVQHLKLKQCKDMVSALEVAVENCADTQRTRMLAGKTMSRGELRERIEALEVH